MSRSLLPAHWSEAAGNSWPLSQLQETTGRTKVISAPSIIATDSIPASLNVGTEVPTLSSQAVTGVQVGGSSAFANTVSDRQSGVTLQILARVTPGGIVTMIINQEVSTPIPAAAGGIQSPSFAKRTLQTQVTVEDGDTIAIGGIMNESNTASTKRHSRSCSISPGSEVSSAAIQPDERKDRVDRFHDPAGDLRYQRDQRSFRGIEGPPEETGENRERIVFMYPLKKGKTASQAHVGLPDGTFEEEHGRKGFYGKSAHLYHAHPPTGWIRFEGKLRPHCFDLNQLKPSDLDDAGRHAGRVSWAMTTSVSTSRAAPSRCRFTIATRTATS